MVSSRSRIALILETALPAVSLSREVQGLILRNFQRTGPSRQSLGTKRELQPAEELREVVICGKVENSGSSSLTILASQASYSTTDARKSITSHESLKDLLAIEESVEIDSDTNLLKQSHGLAYFNRHGQQ